MTTRTLLASVGAVTGAALLYRGFLRRPILNWGATNAEAHARLPGDELLEDADGVATRAITIDAPASAVWPWIAQMGPSPRGGAYTYDWIENLLGLDMHSADRVLPEYQHPQVGDTLGYGKNRMRFERVEPERVLATRSEDGNWVWSFVLDEHDGKTRLISRNRFRLPSADREDRNGSDGTGIARSWNTRCCAASSSAPRGWPSMDGSGGSAGSRPLTDSTMAWFGGRAGAGWIRSLRRSNLRRVRLREDGAEHDSV